MKNLFSPLFIFGVTSALSLSPIVSTVAAEAVVTAQAPGAPTVGASVEVQAPVVTAQIAAPVVQAAPARLPYGVADVVKLSHAQVSDDVIISYLQNSGSTSSLTPDDILRLRNEGVSDRVINAMLEKNTRALQAAQAAAAAQSYAQNTAAAVAPQPDQNVAEAPLTPSAPASSTYVIPYPQATAAYYGYPYYYPYYPYYYGPRYYGYYGGPAISFRFGFGGHGGHFGGHGGHFHGGHH